MPWALRETQMEYLAANMDRFAGVWDALTRFRFPKVVACYGIIDTRPCDKVQQLAAANVRS